MADSPAKKGPRLKTDRNMIVWIAVIAMAGLIVWLFLSQGADLGQGKVDAQIAKKKAAEQAQLYDAKIDDPKAAAKAQLEAAQNAIDDKNKAARQAALAAANNALTAPAPSSTIPLPPPKTSLDTAQLDRLDDAANAIGGPENKSAGPGAAPFVMFQADAKSSGHMADAFKITPPASASSTASAPKANDDNSQDPEVKAAYQRLQALQQQQADYQKLAAGQANQTNAPGGEGNQAWLYSRQNEKVNLASSRTAVRSPALYWLAPGTVIHGVIENAIDTSLPGTLTARVTQPVYDSRYGRYLVIPAGSVLKGSYNTSVQDGQKRVMAGFDTLVTPAGGMVDLGNLSGADNIGRGGIPGSLHTRFWQRAGIATLLAFEAVGMSRLDNQQVVSPFGGSGSSPNSQGAQVIGNFANEEMKRRFATGPYITANPGAVMTLTLTDGVEIPPIANAR